MAFAEYHDAYLADFGQVAIYNATDGATPSVTGFFDATPAGLFGDGMRGAALTFKVQTAAIEADPRGAALVIGSNLYRIDDADDDGTGWTSLMLTRQAPTGYATAYSRGFA